MIKIIPINDVPRQDVKCVLNNQSTRLVIAQKATGLFVDLYVDDALKIGGVIAENLNKIVRDLYRGFVGDVYFVDSEGLSDPSYPGLGSRYLLYYNSEA